VDVFIVYVKVHFIGSGEEFERTKFEKGLGF
jgi:hypothetical protein